jgi:hypothetical protein
MFASRFTCETKNARQLNESPGVILNFQTAKQFAVPCRHHFFFFLAAFFLAAFFFTADFLVAFFLVLALLAAFVFAAFFFVAFLPPKTWS